MFIYVVGALQILPMDFNWAVKILRATMTCIANLSKKQVWCGFIWGGTVDLPPANLYGFLSCAAVNPHEFFAFPLLRLSSNIKTSYPEIFCVEILLDMDRVVCGLLALKPSVIKDFSSTATIAERGRSFGCEPKKYKKVYYTIAHIYFVHASF